MWKNCSLCVRAWNTRVSRFLQRCTRSRLPAVGFSENTRHHWRHTIPAALTCCGRLRLRLTAHGRASLHLRMKNNVHSQWSHTRSTSLSGTTSNNRYLTTMHHEPLKLQHHDLVPSKMRTSLNCLNGLAEWLNNLHVQVLSPQSAQQQVLTYWK